MQKASYHRISAQIKFLGRYRGHSYRMQYIRLAGLTLL